MYAMTDMLGYGSQSMLVELQDHSQEIQFSAIALHHIR
jgi:hypothetical protein